MRTMTKLTEDMIIARTKSSDLGAVKKLNCWGSDLVDISLVKRLSNVEVLSLSLNKITSLCDFQFCRNLVELYIRRNSIHDLTELCYLQDLPRLKRLLLAENPCVETAGPAYRATVIRCLPNLEVLDNNEVSTEEVEHALKSGLILEHPMARRERSSPEPYYREDSPITGRAPPMGRRNSTAVEYEEAFRNSSVLSRSPPADYSASSPYIQGVERRSPPTAASGPVVTGGMVDTEVCLLKMGVVTNGVGPKMKSRSNSVVSEDRGPSPPTSNHITNNNITTTNSSPHQHPPSDIPPPNPLPTSRRVERSPVPPQEPYQHREHIERERQEFPQDLSNGYQQRRGSTDYVQETSRNYQDPYSYDHSPPPQQRNSSTTAIAQRYGPSNRAKSRAKAQNGGTRFMEQNPAGPRSSNLLSAVLCLIPELDWASLEVAELAIRRRMDELLSD